MNRRSFAVSAAVAGGLLSAACVSESPLPEGADADQAAVAGAAEPATALPVATASAAESDADAPQGAVERRRPSEEPVLVPAGGSALAEVRTPSGTTSEAPPDRVPPPAPSDDEGRAATCDTLDAILSLLPSDAVADGGVPGDVAPDRLTGAFEALAGRVRTRLESVVVFNPLSWPRSDAARAAIPAPGPDMPAAGAWTSGPHRVVWQRDGDEYVFVAPDIPAFGLRAIAMERAAAPEDGTWAAFSEGTIENRFFRVTLDSATGAVTGVFDRTAGRRIDLPAGGGEAATAEASVQRGAAGPVFASLVVRAGGAETAYVLYRDLPRLEVVTRAPGRGRQVRASIPAGGPSAVAGRAGWEQAQPLMSVEMPANPGGDLEPLTGFLDVTPAEAMAAGFRRAADGAGWTAIVHGPPGTASLRFPLFDFGRAEAVEPSGHRPLAMKDASWIVAIPDSGRVAVRFAPRESGSAGGGGQ